jgi:hypothetical protein
MSFGLASKGGVHLHQEESCSHNRYQIEREGEDVAHHIVLQATHVSGHHILLGPCRRRVRQTYHIKSGQRLGDQPSKAPRGSPTPSDLPALLHESQVALLHQDL